MVQDISEIILKIFNENKGAIFMAYSEIQYIFVLSLQLFLPHSPLGKKFVWPVSQKP